MMSVADNSARSLLDMPEQEVEEGGDTRIVRRGDEHLPGTADQDLGCSFGQWLNGPGNAQ